MNRANPACFVRPTSELLSNIPADCALVLHCVKKIAENVMRSTDNLVLKYLMTKPDGQFLILIVISFARRLLSCPCLLRSCTKAFYTSMRIYQGYIKKPLLSEGRGVM